MPAESLSIWYSYAEIANLVLKKNSKSYSVDPETLSEQLAMISKCYMTQNGLKSAWYPFLLW